MWHCVVCVTSGCITGGGVFLQWSPKRETCAITTTATATATTPTTLLKDTRFTRGFTHAAGLVVGERCLAIPRAGGVWPL